LANFSNMFEIPSLKYGYSNARVKGMKGLLFKQDFLDELIKVGSVDSMIELLQRTHYKEELVALSVRYGGSELVELAVGANVRNVVRKIRKITPKSDLPIMDALLKRWDLLNLKMIVTARRAGYTFDAVKPYLISVGSLSEADLEHIASADEKNVFEVIKRTELGKELLSQSNAMFNREMWSAFRKALVDMNSFVQLQTMFDAYIHIFIDKNLSSPKKPVQEIRRIFKKEVDVRNVAILWRLKARGVDKSKMRDYLIRGGSLPETTISAIIDAKDIQAIVPILRPKLPAFELSSEDPTLVELEIALEKAIAAEKVRMFHRSILSIGTLLGFVLLKEEELNNLRKISKGKEFGIPESELKAMLVVV